MSCSTHLILDKILSWTFVITLWYKADAQETLYIIVCIVLSQCMIIFPSPLVPTRPIIFPPIDPAAHSHSPRPISEIIDQLILSVDCRVVAFEEHTLTVGLLLCGYCSRYVSLCDMCPNARIVRISSGLNEARGSSAVTKQAAPFGSFHELLYSPITI